MNSCKDKKAIEKYADALYKHIEKNAEILGIPRNIFREKLNPAYIKAASSEEGMAFRAALILDGF